VHIHRYITTLNDPYKQGQYSNVLKTLQEERSHLQDIEAALDDFKKGPAAASSRPSQVSEAVKQKVTLYGCTTALDRHANMVSTFTSCYYLSTVVECPCCSAAVGRPIQQNSCQRGRRLQGRRRGICSRCKSPAAAAASQGAAAAAVHTCFHMGTPVWPPLQLNWKWCMLLQPSTSAQVLTKCPWSYAHCRGRTVIQMYGSHLPGQALEQAWPKRECR
jgi:hypothetical protein